MWVPALAGDTAFAAWLDASGLTLAEAARIQVPYMDPNPAPVSVAGLTRDPAYAAASVLTVGGAVATSLVNGLTNGAGRGRVRNGAGLVMGSAALGLAAVGLVADDASPVLSAANAAVGTASLWIATRGMRRHRHAVLAERERQASLAQRAVITPLVPVSRQSGAGVSVSLTF